MSDMPSTSETLISCPECKTRFPLAKAILSQLERQFEDRLGEALAQRDRLHADALQLEIAQAKSQAASQARRDQSLEIEAMQCHLAEQAECIRDHQVAELALRKKTRELEQREKGLILEVERRLDEATQVMENEVSARLLEQHRLKDLEKDRRLSDLQHQLEEVTRRAQQGSQQLQGEILEDDLEERLKEMFPLDRIEPVAKGVRGADLVHHVCDARGQTVGSILWEAKNTKAFSDSWLPKLRADQRAQKADLAVLISTVLPKGVSYFGYRDLVWVTGPATCMALGYALRAGVLEAARARVTASGQTEKQAVLFQYLSGLEFRQRVEIMVEALASLCGEIPKERRAMEAQWARREQQLKQALSAVASLYGDVSGIIGGQLGRIASLELPPPKSAA